MTQQQDWIPFSMLNAAHALKREEPHHKLWMVAFHSISKLIVFCALLVRAAEPRA